MTAGETNAAGFTGSSSLSFTYDTVRRPLRGRWPMTPVPTTSPRTLRRISPADATATPTLTQGTTVLGSTTANPSGVWAFTPTGLAQGAQTVTASETNAADMTRSSSSATFTYDPATPTVTAQLAYDTGSSSTDHITSNDALTGTADANATVTLTEGSTVLGTTTANSSGVWDFTPTGLAQGPQTITASETNAAGLTGSSALTFTYDTVTPTVTSETVSGTGASANAGLLSPGEAVKLTLGFSEAVTVTGGVPTLTLNNGGTATFDAAHSTSISLVFDYTVGTDQFTKSLAVTGVDLNGAAVTDAAGNAANFSNVDTTFAKLTVGGAMPVATPNLANATLIGSDASEANTGTGALAHESGDNFIFNANLGNQTINHFNTANDVIDLPNNVASSFAAIQADMHQVGTDTVIALDPHNSITISHVAAQQLTAQNFHFII